MPVENGSKPESPPVENTAPAPAAAPDTGALQTQDLKPADSSPAKDESLLGRVKAALEPKPEGSSPSKAGQEAAPNSEASPESDDKEPEGDPTEEELARYHSKTRKRMNKLMTERNAARDEAEKLRPDADIGRRITGFISDAGMTGDEANLLLDIGRNMKRDPLKAWEQLKPYVAALQKMAGDALPDDLQAAVTKGEITDAYARQLARGRTETTVLSQRTRAQDEQAQQRQQADQTARHADAVAQTISTWESNQAKQDPDWKLKQERIGELIELEVRRTGYPKTTQAALDMAEKAKTKATAEIARFAPRPQPVTSLNPASATRVAPAKPTTALEAARQALAPTG